jgi:hypothetical protein
MSLQARDVATDRLTQQCDLVLLAVKGHEGVQAAADAACTALLNAVAQEDDLPLVRIQYHTHDVALGEGSCICCHAAAPYADNSVAKVVGAVTQVLQSAQEDIAVK